MADEDLAERVRRLEIAVAALQSQVDARGVDGPEEGFPEEPTPTRDLETTLGTYWLSRAGILALITGLAWFIGLHFGDVGPVLRVALGYGLAGLVAAVGLWFSRSQRLFGHVVLGGGLAVGYFVTYALHFVAPLRIVDSQVLGLLLLAMAVLAIVAVAQRLSSETTAGIALFLGFHTSLVGTVDTFALVSTALLAGAAAFFFVKNRWVVVPLSSMIAVYVRHAFVVQRVDDATTAQVVPALALLCVYFLVFSVAVLLRPRQLTQRVTLGFALFDGLAFVGLGASTCLHQQRGLLPPFYVVALLLLAGCAFVARRRESTVLVEVYAGGVAVVTALLLAELLGTWAQAACTVVLGGVVVFVAARLRLRALGIVGSALAATGTLVPWPGRTLGWVLAAAVLVGLGFVIRERWLRLAGLGVVALAVLKLLVFDFAGLPTDQRILTFVVSGVLLLGLSFAYGRFKGQLERLL